MPNRVFQQGIQALKDLLPPLEDCPNCGNETESQKAKQENKSQSAGQATSKY